MTLEAVNLSEHRFAPLCDRGCGRPATVIAKGCMDATPVMMCDECFDRGLDVIKTYVRLYQKLNKRVCICGDCHRPILGLDTHLEAKRL